MPSNAVCQPQAFGNSGSGLPQNMIGQRIRELRRDAGDSNTDICPTVSFWVTISLDAGLMGVREQPATSEWGIKWESRYKVPVLGVDLQSENRSLALEHDPHSYGAY